MHTPKSIAYLLSCLAILSPFAASSLDAQDIATAPLAIDANTESTADETIVVTASRLALTIDDIGSAVALVSAADIADGQHLFVTDVLQDIAAVHISSDRPGDRTSVSIRGSDNNQVLWLVDGIELGDPSLISTEFQADHLTTQDIAQLAVLRGNQSSLYGADAIGGVVNIITQRAQEHGLSLSAEAEGGRYGTAQGGASLLGKYGALDFRVTANGYRHSGPSLADPATANPAGSAEEADSYTRYGASGRIGVAASATLDLQLLGFWRDSDSDLDNDTSDSDDTVRKEEYALAVQGDYQSTDSRFSVDAHYSRYASRRLFFGQFYAPQGDVYRGTKDSVTLNLGFRGGVWSLVAGGNWESESTRQVTNFSGTFAAKIITKATYTEIALRPLANLTVSGAARLDDNSRFGTFDSYRGTIAYRVPSLSSGVLKLRASYGTGAKAPGLYQLFDPTFGNPDLRVETSRGGDVGLDISTAHVTAQVSYFFTNIRNEISFDFPSGYIQRGRTRNRGIEVDLRFSPLETLTIQQSFTYLKAEQDALENGSYRDIGRPRYSGTTSVTARPVEHFSLTARLRYRGRNAASFGGVTAAYHVLDILGAYQISESIEVYGRVTNLFDRDYQVSFGKNALGRAAYIGVRVRF